MHKTIANKLYDTATARVLGNWQKGYSSDRGYLSETLYLKKTGDYFLHGEGGPRSRYAQRVAPNTWGYGERILPLTNEEAQDWAENHLTESAYDEIFGEVTDDGTLSPITLKLRSATIEKLHRAAREGGKQLSEMAESLLAVALQQMEAQNLSNDP